MANVFQSQIQSHSGCSSTICYCFAAVKTKAAPAGTGRTTGFPLVLFTVNPVVFFEK